MRATGQVLGIDVGFSTRSRTTCFCLLRWDADTARFEFRRTTSDAQERRVALAGLLQANRKVEAVAVDGPLGPGLAGLTEYRSAEAFLSQGRMQKRGKPGQTSSPIGQSLHLHATDLATLVLDLADVSDASHAEAIHGKRIVEAFPNTFLAAMIDDSAFTALARNASDVFWQRLIGTGGLKGLSDKLLPNRAVSPRFDLIAHHDERAGVVCALTALAVMHGCYVAVGDPLCGDIILPPLTAWGADEVGERWLRSVLDSAEGRIRRSRKPKRGFAVARVLAYDLAP